MVCFQSEPTVIVGRDRAQNGIIRNAAAFGTGQIDTDLFRIDNHIAVDPDVCSFLDGKIYSIVGTINEIAHQNQAVKYHVIIGIYAVVGFGTEHFAISEFDIGTTVNEAHCVVARWVETQIVK